MAYSNRNSFFRTIVKNALNNLTAFDSGLEVLDYINERETPSISVTMQSEKNRSNNADIGQIPNLATLETTSYLELVLIERIKSGSDFSEWSDDWIEQIEYQINNISLQGSDGEQVISIDGNDFYRLKIKDIFIDSLQKTEEARGQNLGFLKINLRIEFNRTYY